MNLKSLIHRLPFLGGMTSVLVCETDGLQLRGAVISRHGENLEVGFSAKSESKEYTQAVNELVISLRQQGWQGNQAVLLTPAVFSALIELPISPKQPRTPLQMQELVRWELEPLLIQHYATWSIGQVLLTLGYLTEPQLKEVVERQQGKSKSGLGDGHGGIYSFKRFGELAIEMGFINQAQLDECVAKQAWLRADSEEISCGWSAQNGEDTAYTADGQPATYTWLASGINTGVLRQWEAAFATHKLTLNEVYPLTGCAVALVDSAQDLLVLESVDGLVSGAHLRAGNVVAIESTKKSFHTELDAFLESYHNLVSPDNQQVWLATNSQDSAHLAQSLGEMIGRELQLLPKLNAQVSTGMTALASSLLLNPLNHRLAGVSVRGPQPSLFQRVEVRAIAAGLLFVLLIGALEASLLIRKELAQTEHTKIAAEKKKFDALVATAQAKVDAVNKVKDDIKSKTDELANLNARYDFFAVELSARARFVKTFLDDLASSVSEEVVINSLDETPNFGIKVSAWALSEKAAQQFIQSFKNAMAPTGMDLVDPIVRSQTGRLGLLGYDINFRLVNLKDLEVNTPKAPATQPARKNKKR